MTMVAKPANPPQETRVSDLQVAAFLLSSDFALLRTEGSSPRIEFVFAAPEEAVFRFYRGDCLVNARKLLDSYRNLKGLLMQRDQRERR